MEYIPMTTEQFIMEESPDEQYYFYRPAVPLQIFHSMVEPDEDSENCCIEVSVRYDLQQMLPIINRYLEWLASCEAEVTAYFQERLGEEVPEGWFDTIEVFSVFMVFDDLDDYGATIEFAESILCDHTIEFDLEEYEIVDDRLNG